MASRVAMVDTATWLFPQHTLDALAAYLAQESVDPVVLQQLVDAAVASALGDRDVQMQATDTQVQWRASSTDDWHTLLLIEDLNKPSTDALAAHVIAPEPHPAYDDMASLTLIFENHLV
jgi:hypothetical protein